MTYYNSFDDRVYSYNDLDPMYDGLYSDYVGDSFVIGPPIYHPADAMLIDPTAFLDPYINYTSEIVYLWNNFDPDKRRYVIDRFGNFHPRDEVYWDFERNYGWNDLFTFWELDDPYTYFDNRYIITNEGRINLLSLILFMRDIAGTNLAELAKKQCCTREKAIAEAIWNEMKEAAFQKNPKDALNATQTKAIKAKVRTSYTEPGDAEINKIYEFMWECYQARTRSGKFVIGKFLDKVALTGITGSGASFKKYLLFKKKYLDKKILKK